MFVTEIDCIYIQTHFLIKFLFLQFEGMLFASASATTVLPSQTLPTRNDDSGVCMNDVSHSPVNHPTQSNVNQSSGAAHGTNKVVMTTGKEGDEKAVLESDQTYPGCFPWACGITMDNAGALKRGFHKKHVH